MRLLWQAGRYRRICSSTATATAEEHPTNFTAVVSTFTQALAAGLVDEQQERELQSAIDRSVSSPSDIARIIRSFPDYGTAFGFYKWLETSKPSAGDRVSVFGALFELADKETSAKLQFKTLLDEFMKHGGDALSLDSAALLVRRFSHAGMIVDALRAFSLLPVSHRNTPICNILLRHLLRSSDPRHHQEALAVVRNMVRDAADLRCPPDKETGSVVFSAIWDKLSVVDNDTADLAVQLAESGVAPSNAIQFAQVVTRFCRCGLTGKAWDLLHAVRRAGGPVETDPCNALLTGLGIVGDFSSMELLFGKMKEWGVELNIVTYEILVNYLCKRGRVADGLKVFEIMSARAADAPESAVVPDVKLYNTIISGLCKQGRMEEGIECMHKMKARHGHSPNTVTYNTLIDGFCKVGEISKAKQLLEQMNQEQVPSNVVTMNTIIDGMCRQGMLGTALEFFHEFSLSDNGVKGNAVTYSTLIGVFLHANNVDKAMELFDEMVADGQKPDSIVYYTLISGLSQAGKIQQAFSVSSQMERDGFSLDIRCYNILINGFCKKKQLHKALTLLDEAIKKAVLPDRVTFNTLIGAACNAGDFFCARLLLNKMITSNHTPCVITFGAFIHGYCKVGDLDNAMEFFRTMNKVRIRPNTVILNMFIEFFGKSGQVSAVLSLMDSMQSQGVPISTVTCNSVFRSLRDNNMTEEACKLMEKMKEQGCKPNCITLEILTEWFSTVGEFAKLKSFLQETVAVESTS